MSYSSPQGHRSMVFDEHRNRYYDKAMREVIGPTTRVMDLGAGLGVHGLMAAGMGAAAVHMVEPTAVVHLAETVAKANDLHGVFIHKSRVEQLNLDSKVDLIVSVFTGNFLLDEDLLPSLFYARDKFLAPGGKLIPDRARMWIAPVSAGEYYQKHVARWSNPVGKDEVLAGLDYSAVQPYAACTPLYDVASEFKAEVLAEPVCVQDLDFSQAQVADCDAALEVTATRDGQCHGWLGWFETRLGDSWLSTGPDSTETHWSQVLFALPEPISLRSGETLALRIKRPQYGEWSWLTRHGEWDVRQSTFLSKPFTHKDLLKRSGQFKPIGNRRAAAAVWVLARMDGSHSLDELAQTLSTDYGDLFPAQGEALSYVRGIARNYCD